MQLKELKLSGFKSFVEPTTIPFPSSLVGIVGPNGCGKSNIIDAVRWVMGESSAKNLRGESMVDVVFNGSLNRKPVGQASVELVFDNSLGRLTGAFANYQEISIKRVVTRDGESAYYLNGSRCRRRDINDIFLGTGAGSRGYAIIGQDMISRLVEARPEDLKSYIEEAAGVSKYKERRRETLQRIDHTRENLARVADIREELQKQMQRLERQAKTAERYIQLKKAERQFRGEILALKWGHLKSEQAAIQQELKQLNVNIETHQALNAQFLKQEALFQEAIQNQNAGFQETQEKLYQSGTQIARLEEAVQQYKREQERAEADLATVLFDKEALCSQIQKEQEAYSFSSKAVSSLEEEYEKTHKQWADLEKAHTLLKQKEESFSLKWQEITTKEKQKLHDIEIKKLHLTTLEQRRQQTLSRLEKNSVEKAQLDIVSLEDELLQLKKTQDELKSELSKSIVLEEKAATYESTLKSELNEFEGEYKLAQKEIHKLSTETAGLQAVQEAALHPEMEVTLDGTQPFLIDHFTIQDKKWTNTIEFVLGDGLKSILVYSEAEMLKEMDNRAAAYVLPAQPFEKASVFPTLADKITGILPSWIFSFQRIYAADSLTEALTWLPQLSEFESVATPEGYWIGKGWVKIVNHHKGEQKGLLERKQLLEQLLEQLNLAQQKALQIEQQIEVLTQKIVVQHQETEQNKLKTLSYRENLYKVEAEFNQKSKFVERSQQRLFALAEEVEECNEILESIALEKLKIDESLPGLFAELEQANQNREHFAIEKQEFSELFASSGVQVEEARQSAGKLELEKERERVKSEQLKQNIEREEKRLQTLIERLEILQKEKLHKKNDQSLTDDLAKLTEVYESLQHQLEDKRKEVEASQYQIETLLQAQKEEETHIRKIMEVVQQKTLSEQEQAIKAQGLIESLAELGVDPFELCKILNPDDLSQKEIEQQQLNEKIQRLGAINLIAIEEYQTELERKRHLDEQYEDLTQALSTLESAIAKMDKETELRLGETFDQVNRSFQALFPRLFGGGRAQLELTSDNMLEAGVSILAQPPGKRNSTIHMLSGGEKAMTAVALVFSIFQLNPSPFCMLDEVDAPLDDANVQRFCEMVREMSQFVQFLFITHNKLTMELANHLIGVTMREPGVSRIVAVDVEQALSIVE